MTLIKSILHKVRSHSYTEYHAEHKYSSPPPEIDETAIPIRKDEHFKYGHVKARVDSSPPLLDGATRYRHLQKWRHNYAKLCAGNRELVIMIRRAQLMKGKVDSQWSHEVYRSTQKYKTRMDTLKRIERDNKVLYKRFLNAQPRVQSTSSLRQDWRRNRREILNHAETTFVMFPLVANEFMEDPAFAAPPGVHRPRVHMTIKFLDGAVIGELCLELFTDICPATCRLFIELLDGDTLGHGYVGTRFFRKVPHLYWTGGDVTYDNGFGCYSQRGMTQPIGAENCHFSHSMPGLLSMRVTCDNEVCGIFNMTFKALPQFDLHNVVFGRIIRPSIVYDTAKVLGSALSSHPVIQVSSTRRLLDGNWTKGEPNTRLVSFAMENARKILMNM